MRLAIDASDDLAAWRNVAADGTLVNIEYAGQRLTRNRIDLPADEGKVPPPLVDGRCVRSSSSAR